MVRVLEGEFCTESRAKFNVLFLALYSFQFSPGLRV